MLQCPRCHCQSPDSFALEAHMVLAHPHQPTLRQFEPILKQFQRFPAPRQNPAFPGCDIDAIHRNPRYAAPNKG